MSRNGRCSWCCAEGVAVESESAGEPVCLDCLATVWPDDSAFAVREHDTPDDGEPGFGVWWEDSPGGPEWLCDGLTEDQARTILDWLRGQERWMRPGHVPPIPVGRLLGPGSPYVLGWL